MKKLALSFIIATLGFSASAQLNMSQLGYVPYTEELSDVWGHVDQSGNEYALVGVYDGFSIVDVTTPSTANQVYFLPGINSIWRDIKTWNNYAYISTEGGGGIVIVDMNPLPGAITTTTTFNGSIYPFTTVHNLFIDENGRLYIFGANNGVGGAIMCDLTNDPMNPVEVGRVNDDYFHDGMARGDTLWGAAIYAGYFSVVDVSTPSNTVVMATANTPGSFAHNCWVSDDGDYLFTTDEISSGYIGSFDVSDLGNISEIDREQSNPGSGVIPHNAHFINKYVVTSYYRDGITIHDVARPHNMIEVGNFDTSPAFSGNGFNGSWGVYPWLPSGNVLAADIENGLYILGANYVRGCYLEGNVTDSLCGDALNNVAIEILTTTYADNTDIMGDYAFGTPTAGTYDIQFSKSGYNTKVITGVSLLNGVLTTLDVEMFSSTTVAINGQVDDAAPAGIVNANVLLESGTNTYQFVTDVNGQFSKCNIVSDSYDVYVGKWGYRTLCLTNQPIDVLNTNLLYQLDAGYYDDFTFDFGWTVSGNASAGIWEIGEPVGTSYNAPPPIAANPDLDVNNDCYDQAYVTGNGGGGPGNDDVDNGYTILTSPVFDLTTSCEFYINYYRWFFNDGNGTPDDSLKVKITNGTSTAIVEIATTNSPNNSTWVYNSFKVSDYVTPTATMQIIFETMDVGTGHLVEAAADLFQVVDSSVAPPVAGFTNDVDTTYINLGGQITFTDNSLNNITQWDWDFDVGASPATANTQGPHTVTYSTVGQKTVTLDVTNPECSAQISKTVWVLQSSIGMDQNGLAQNELQVFPNPFSSEVSIAYQLDGDLADDARIQVLDVAGRLAAEISIESSEGKVNFGQELVQGVYFVKIINGEERTAIVKMTKL